MKILAVDRDEMITKMIKSRLEPKGHQVFEETSKNAAIDRLANEAFDVIFLDPTPLTSPRPVILNMRRSVGNYPYIFLSSNTATQEEAIKAGCNDLLKKPVDAEVFDKQIENAQDFSELVARIGDDSEDFPSAGGVIAKSAFNQLFLSAIDRADRYGEQTYALFITMSNYRDILEMDGLMLPNTRWPSSRNILCGSAARVILSGKPQNISMLCYCNALFTRPNR